MPSIHPTGRNSIKQNSPQDLLSRNVCSDSGYLGSLDIYEELKYCNFSAGSSFTNV